MPQDAFSIFHTAKELNNLLVGGKIDKINQPDKDSLLLYLRANNQNVMLSVSAKAESARVCLTCEKLPAPINAPAFCMLLRKHLSHAVIKEVSSVPFERIIKIVFESKNDLREETTKIIYAEIMGKYSNITLTENGVILGAIKQSPSIEGLRPIFPGLKYVLPKPQDKIELSDKVCAIEALKGYSGSDLPSFIFNTFKGVSYQTALEIVERYFVKINQFTFDIKTFNIEDFYKHFLDFYNNTNIKANVVLQRDTKDFFVTDYITIDKDKTYYNSINEAIDSYYTKRNNAKSFEDKKRKLSDIVKAYEKKINKKYQIALEKLLNCADMENNMIYGQLLIANLYRIPIGASSVTLENYYTESQEPITIKLDNKLSGKENAERYFKKYNKEKKTVKAVEPQIEELKNLLSYISSLFDEIELCKSMIDFIEIEEELQLIGLIKSQTKSKKTKSPKSVFRTYNHLGFDIFVGRNNLQNERLLAEANRTDLWLHTKDYHSSHVIIRTENKPVPDMVLLFAAELCAYYSKAQNADKVPVDYTLRKYVKKQPNGKIGSVFYTDYKTILVTPNPHD